MADKAFASIVTAILLALAATDAAAINKCTDKAGKITYQEGKCPDNASQHVIKPPTPRPAPDTRSRPEPVGGPGADDKREDDTIVHLVSVQTGFEGCVNASPGFAQRHAATYAAWRSDNASALARLESSERYRVILENGRRQLGDPSMHMPGVREKLAKFCEVQFIPALRNTLRK